MKTLVVALLLLSCDPPAPQDDPKLDPQCQEYVAMPGEPCRAGHWLYILPHESPACICFTKRHPQ